MGNSKEKELLEAARSGDEGCIRSLIEQGVDVNAGERDNWTALMWACEKGYEGIARLLVNAGANVNAATTRGTVALDIAETYTHSQGIAAFLKSQGAKTAYELGV